MGCIMNGASKRSVTVRRFFDEWLLASLMRGNIHAGFMVVCNGVAIL